MNVNDLVISRLTAEAEATGRWAELADWADFQADSLLGVCQAVAYLFDAAVDPSVAREVDRLRFLAETAGCLAGL